MQHIIKHGVVCIGLLLVVWWAARHFGYVGPNASIQLPGEVMYPVAFLGGIWGLYRILTQ